MSGIKGRSGRKPRHEEEKRILKQLYPLAVSRVRDILHSRNASEGTILEAAKVVIYQIDGKPHISIDQRISGVIGIITPDQLEQATRVPQLEEAKLIAQYSVEGGINAIQREGLNSNGEDEVLQGEEEGSNAGSNE